jgi:hypothetical protein
VKRNEQFKTCQEREREKEREIERETERDREREREKERKITFQVECSCLLFRVYRPGNNSFPLDKLE